MRPRRHRVHAVNRGLGHLLAHVAYRGLAYEEEEDEEDGPANQIGDQVDGDAPVVVANLEGVGLVEANTTGLFVAHCQLSSGYSCTAEQQIQE